MSVMRGIMITCDRCGKWIFKDDFKMTAAERQEYRKSFPVTWTRQCGADLCPDCSVIWSEHLVKYAYSE